MLVIAPASRQVEMVLRMCELDKLQVHPRRVQLRL